MALALHVLKGKFKGQEYLLPEAGDFVLGSAGTDEVLFNYEGSQQVAQLEVQGDAVQLKVTGAPRGIMVNGKPATGGQLHEGDRVDIGKTRFMLLTVIKYSAVAAQAKARAAAAAAQAEAAGGGPAAESGSLAQHGLGDLLRRYCQPEFSGVLNLTIAGDSGAVMISQGQIADAFVTSSPAPSVKRALFRLFRWRTGGYVFQASPPKPAAQALKEPLASILAQAEEERDAIAGFEAALPPLDSRLVVAKLPAGQVNKLMPAEMFILGLVRMHGTVRGVVDNHPENDLVVCRLLAGLLQRKIVCAAETLA